MLIEESYQVMLKLKKDEIPDEALEILVYKKQGIGGIPDKPREGRPPKLTKKQELKIKEIILNKVPAEVGFPAEFNWTAGLIAKFIQREYGVNYSIFCLGQLEVDVDDYLTKLV